MQFEAISNLQLFSHTLKTDSPDLPDLSGHGSISIYSSVIRVLGRQKFTFTKTDSSNTSLITMQISLSERGRRPQKAVRCICTDALFRPETVLILSALILFFIWGVWGNMSQILGSLC